MHYIIYAGAMHETTVENDIRTHIPRELYHRVFHPVRRMKKKFYGEWRTVTEKLVPGYVFLECDDIQAFYGELGRRRLWKRILGREYGEQGVSFYAMTPEEEDWLEKLMVGSDTDADGNVTLDLSQVGFNENDEVVILSGPLQSVRGLVKRINLHRRVAEIQVDFMGTSTTMYLGIDLVASKDRVIDQD